MQEPRRIFLLSPAHCGGKRAALIHRPQARFELALQLRTPAGVPLGQVFSFLSGLYFRGKLAYANRFANAPAGITGQQIITTNRGLVAAHESITLAALQKMGTTQIDPEDRRYRDPLTRAAKRLRDQIPPDCEIILLGSIATGKYVDVLQEVFANRLLFPQEFLGRGDMSRGGLLLRCVDEAKELTYIQVAGAARKGQRPPKLSPRTAT